MASVGESPTKGEALSREKFSHMERAALAKFWVYPEVQDLIKDGKQTAATDRGDRRKMVSDGTWKKVANRIQKLIEDKEDISQRANESREAWYDRLWVRAQDPACQWLAAKPGDSKEKYLQRFEKTSGRIHEWVKNYQKRQKATPFRIPPLSLERKSRSKCGVDLFKTSDDPALPKTKQQLLDACDPAADSWTFVDWSRDAARAWNDLPQERKAHYETLAAEVTARIAEEEAEADEAGCEDLQQAEIDRESRRRDIVKHFPAHLRDCVNLWSDVGGLVTFVLAGGLTEDGELRCWMESVGVNKAGHTFQQKVADYAHWPADMLQTLFYQFVGETLSNGGSTWEEGSVARAPLSGTTGTQDERTQLEQSEQHYERRSGTPVELETSAPPPQTPPEPQASPGSPPSEVQEDSSRTPQGRAPEPDREREYPFELNTQLRDYSVPSDRPAPSSPSASAAVTPEPDKPLDSDPPCVDVEVFYPASAPENETAEQRDTRPPSTKRKRAASAAGSSSTQRVKSRTTKDKPAAKTGSTLTKNAARRSGQMRQRPAQASDASREQGANAVEDAPEVAGGAGTPQNAATNEQTMGTRTGPRRSGRERVSTSVRRDRLMRKLEE